MQIVMYIVYNPPPHTHTHSQYTHHTIPTAADRRLANLEAYLEAHPLTAVIEHPRDIARIVSRYVLVYIY